MDDFLNNNSSALLGSLGSPGARATTEGSAGQGQPQRAGDQEGTRSENHGKMMI